MNRLEIYVGVCAFSYRYLTQFKTLEIQNTFYNIPKEATVRKWKESAPSDFKFAFKVFQGITHSSKSKTWRRYRGKNLEEIKNSVGDLKLNKITESFWEQTFEIAKTLKAEVAVVQTPSSFKPTDKNILNVEYSFKFAESKLEERKIVTLLGWEPRGEWLEKRDILKRIFENSDRTIHIVDPFHHEPVFYKDIQYFRLHGKPYLNYKYEYTDRDYEELLKKIEKFENEGVKRVFIMFNNIQMLRNAKEFKEKLRSEKWKVY